MRIKQEFLKLLKEDTEFRYAVLGYLGLDTIVKSIESLQRQFREFQKEILALQKQVAEHSKAIRSLQEQVKALQEQVKILQEQVKNLQVEVKRHGEILEKHTHAIEKLTATINAIDTRYGVLTEEAFRESIKYLVQDLLKEYNVIKWTYYDEEGLVYAHPAVIDVDVLIRDKEHIIVEYKASVDKSDAAELYRIGKLYEKITKVKPKLLIVSPAIRKRAKELADKLKIECRGKILEI